MDTRSRANGRRVEPLVHLSSHRLAGLIAEGGRVEQIAVGPQLVGDRLQRHVPGFASHGPAPGDQPGDAGEDAEHPDHRLQPVVARRGGEPDRVDHERADQADPR